MKKLSFSVIITCFILFLTSCSFTEKGDSLYSFNQRINSLERPYTLTEQGYFYNPQDQTINKFFAFQGGEILLQFSANQDNKLYKQRLILNKEGINNETSLTFIKDCFKAFINDTEIENNLSEKVIPQFKTHKMPLETVKASYKLTDLEIDVTPNYLDITSVKNNL